MKTSYIRCRFGISILIVLLYMAAYLFVTERVRDGCGLRKERGKRAEADWEWIGRASERTGSRRTWLQLVSCALVHTGVLFRKADQTEKETGGTEVDIQTGDTGGNI